MFEVRSRGGRIVLQVILTILAIPFLLPLVAMVQGSLSGQGWQNYVTVLNVPGFFLFFRNSAIIAVCTVFIVYVVSMLAAFGFSRLHIRGREIYFWAILACMTLPEVVLLTPLFQLAASAGLFNTYWAIIIPLAALHIPFAVLLARNFINGLPDELFEAARVDGANSAAIFWHLIIPLTRPIAAAIVIFVLLAAWNDFLLPLVFLQDPATQTITQIPLFFTGEFNGDTTKILAAGVVTALPEVIAYLCLQRLFERGLSAGAIK